MRLVSFESAPTDLVSKKDRDKIREVFDKDPFSLIDYWCVGTTDEKGVFHESRTVFRDRKGVVSRIMHEVPENCNSVWVTDIFGQTARAFLR